MRITNVFFAAGSSAYYFDDQKAIKAEAVQDGFPYRGEPLTEGFTQIRQSGECISILLELENGAIAQGDCVAVQYSGAAGRDPLFTASYYIPFMQKHVAPLVIGRDACAFLENARRFDTVEIQGARLHTAIRYGLSQAFLSAAALASGKQMFEVIRGAYGLTDPLKPLSFFGQSGDDRYVGADKMILKQVDVLPHGLINNVPKKLGRSGGRLKEYVRWLAERIKELRSDTSYIPTLHIDVYGTIGMIFDDLDAMADYLVELESCARPFKLYIEGPLDAGGRNDQMEGLGALRTALRARDAKVRIVADEWCNTLEDVRDFVDAECCDMVQIKTPDLGSIHNTIEAVLYAKSKGVGAYQGGSCNESDLSARACVHAALATQPDRVLVKPGMGFDEGFTIVKNEMSRALTLSAARQAAE